MVVVTNSKPKGCQSKIAKRINAYSHMIATAVQMAELAEAA